MYSVVSLGSTLKIIQFLSLYENIDFSVVSGRSDSLNGTSETFILLKVASRLLLASKNLTLQGCPNSSSGCSGFLNLNGLGCFGISFYLCILFSFSISVGIYSVPLSLVLPYYRLAQSLSIHG